MRKHSTPLVCLLAAWATVALIQAAAFALAGGNTPARHTIYQGTITRPAPRSSNLRDLTKPILPAKPESDGFAPFD